MQKAAQNSQLKSGKIAGGRVYAFRVNRVNADYVCLKLWLLGGVIRARNIAVASLPALIEQIDVALADGYEVIALDDAEFSATEKVLSGIKKEFSSYCCTGASDANHVPVKPSSDSAESVKKCGAKTKASAPATEQARYISPLCAKGGSDCTAPSASQVRSACGAGVAADISAIRAGFDEMREAQEDFFENLAALLVRIAEVLNANDDTPKQPKGWRKCAVENPLGAAIRTKRGRTSVIVGVRKISTPKKQK